MGYSFKIIIVVFFLILTTTKLFSQKDLFTKTDPNSVIVSKYILDSVYVQKSPEEKHKIIYSYNQNGKLVKKLTQLFINNTWEFFSQDLYSYNSYNKLTKKIVQGWLTDEWINSIRDSVVYDSHQNPTINIIQNWFNDDWNNSTRSSFIYDDFNNLINHVTEIWVNNEWIDQFKYSYTYLDNNKSEYLEQIWEDSHWGNLNREIYFYDSNNNLINTLYQFYWDFGWISHQELILAYDSEGNLLETIKQNIEIDVPIEADIFDKESYYYDNQNNLIRYLFEEWQDGNITNSDQYLYKYDINSNLIQFTSESWEEDQWIPKGVPFNFVDFFGNEFFLHGIEFSFYYGTITEIKNDNILNPSFSLSQNYPNPFNPTTTIEYSIPSVASGFSLSNTTLKIYDVLGKEVETLVNLKQNPGNYKITFNASSLPSGVYFYRLISGSFTETKKLILMK